jgi:outer membrane protein assembly factor BamB
MRTRLNRAWIPVLGLILFTVASAAWGVITALLPLRAVLAQSNFILVTRVEKLYPERPGLILAVMEEMKGKASFRQLTVNLKGDTGSQKTRDTERLLKRLAPDLPLIVFINKRGDAYTGFGYTNGTWLQITKTGSSPAWSFTHLEPYLRRTFKGTTAELGKVVRDSLAGKAKLPAPNPNEKPGLGPEVEKKKPAPSPKEAGQRNAGRSLFAVIPTLGVGGPLAILALLFPSIFGGVFVLFRRWLAFFTVVSVISLLYLVHWLFGDHFRQSWWGTSSAFWLALIVTTSLGAFWAWQRHWVLLGTGQESEVPGKAEHVVLWAISLVCLGLVIFYQMYPAGMQERDLLWSFSAGVWAGTAYRIFRSTLGSRAASPALPTEAIMLGMTLFVLAGLGARPRETAGSQEAAEGAKAQLVGLVWDFQVPYDGCAVSAPRVAGGHIYFAASLPAFKKGTLYCLNRGTGDEIWPFIDDNNLQQVFSSPCVAEGRLYIGEGFHDSSNCKLYCLDALTGKKLWDFPTTSQVESTPCVVGDKVFFGGGNDGIYCLDTKEGKKEWQYPGPAYKGRLIRVGAGPAVVNGRLFVGSGIDRNLDGDQGETSLFCLEASRGKLVWKVEVDLPSWGTPVLAGDKVFFGLGNGDILSDAPAPAGAMLCLKADTGEKVWRVDVPNGVLDRPVIDEDHVYFGCRDGHCYCLRRDTGELVWKTSLDSPVIGGPTLAPSLKTGATASVYVAGSGGRVCCLDPATGAIEWTYNLEKYSPHLCTAPQIVVSRTIGGERRHIYFAATLGDPNSGRPVLYRLNDFMPEQ